MYCNIRMKKLVGVVNRAVLPPYRPVITAVGGCHCLAFPDKALPNARSLCKLVRVFARCYHDASHRTREVGASHLRRNGSSGAGDGGGDRTCLRYLSDGGDGFVVGVDGQGRIGARSVLTGEPRVFLTRDNAATAVKNDAGEADFFATLDCDPSSGIVALAAAGVKGGVDAATSVELYRLYR